MLRLNFLRKMSKKESQENESWYEWNDYNDFKILDMNVWDNRLRTNPITGYEVKNAKDLIELLTIFDGNPFENTDSYDIFY